jgi:hypothetical protein
MNQDPHPYGPAPVRPRTALRVRVRTGTGPYGYGALYGLGQKRTGPYGYGSVRVRVLRGTWRKRTGPCGYGSPQACLLCLQAPKDPRGPFSCLRRMPRSRATRPGPWHTREVGFEATTGLACMHKKGRQSAVPAWCVSEGKNGVWRHGWCLQLTRN